MLLDKVRSIPGKVDPDDTQGREGNNLQTISEERNVLATQVSRDTVPDESEKLSDEPRTQSNVRYSNRGQERNDVNFYTSRSMNNSVHSSTSQSSKGTNMNASIITIGTIALGICEISGVTSLGTTWSTILLGTGTVFSTLPGYCASMLAHLRVTTEATETAAESMKGVVETLEMIGLMKDEADRLTEVLKVDKISTLVTIPTPRMKFKMEEAEIEEDRLGNLLIGFEVFREFYFKQDTEEQREDGSMSRGNSFKVSSYNASTHRFLMGQAGVTDSSIIVSPRVVCEEMSAIRKTDSASISQMPSTESEEIKKSGNIDMQRDEHAYPPSTAEQTRVQENIPKIPKIKYHFHPSPETMDPGYKREVEKIARDVGRNFEREIDACALKSMIILM